MAAQAFDEFKHLLQGITASKRRIGDAAKHCLQHEGQFSQLFALLMHHLVTREEDGRAPLIYLVDCILQNSVKKVGVGCSNVFIDCVARELPGVIGLGVPQGGTSKPHEMLLKVVLGWKTKEFFSETAVDAALANSEHGAATAMRDHAKMPTLALPVFPVYVRALFDLDSKRPNELVFQAGEALEAQSQLDDNWYQGRNRLGKEGMFPITYVETLPARPDDFPAPATAADPEQAATTSTAAAVPAAVSDAAAKPINAHASGAKRAAESAAPAERQSKRARKVAYEPKLTLPDPTIFNPALPTAPSPPSSPKPGPSTVFLFDLDETLIVFNDLLTGAYAKAAAKDEAMGKLIGEFLEGLIFDVADGHYFFEQLQDCDQMHIEGLAAHDDSGPLDAYKFEADGFAFDKVAETTDAATWRKAAYRFRKIRRSYSKNASFEPDGCTHVAKAAYTALNAQSISLPAGARVRAVSEDKGGWRKVRIAGGAEGWAPTSYLADIPSSKLDGNAFRSLGDTGLLSEEAVLALTACHRDLQAFTDGWLQTAKRALTHLASLDAELVLVTNTQLVPCLVKLMLFSLSELFPVENVFSSAKTGKPACFKAAMERFGEAKYIGVGDSVEERRACKRLGLDFHHVGGLSDLQAFLRRAERDGLALRPPPPQATS